MHGCRRSTVGNTAHATLPKRHPWQEQVAMIDQLPMFASPNAKRQSMLRRFSPMSASPHAEKKYPFSRPSSASPTSPPAPAAAPPAAPPAAAAPPAPAAAPGSSPKVPKLSSPDLNSSEGGWGVVVDVVVAVSALLLVVPVVLSPVKVSMRYKQQVGRMSQHGSRKDHAWW